MMTTSKRRSIIDTILLVVLAGGMVFLIWTVFHKAEADQEDALKYEIKIRDLSIAEKDSAIKAMRIAIARRDSTYSSVISSINAIGLDIDEIKKERVKIIHEYEEIPNRVRNYNRDDLRRAFSKNP
jgi:hypothetical protein